MAAISSSFMMAGQIDPYIQEYASQPVVQSFAEIVGTSLFWGCLSERLPREWIDDFRRVASGAVSLCAEPSCVECVEMVVMQTVRHTVLKCND